MGRSKETFGKKENEKNKQKKRKEKEEKKKERKAKGSASFEDMIAYVDEYGRLSSTPPEAGKIKEEIDASNISIGVKREEAREPEDLIHTGTVSFFNDQKGFGFIRDDKTGQSLFVHVSTIKHPIKERDKVSYEIERGPRGMTAINVGVTDKK